MRTKKPCPGCGQVDPYRPADKVCSDCHTKLRRSEKTDKELEAAAKQPGLVPVSLPWAIHAYPYIPDCRDRETGREPDREFYTAADVLLRCSGVYAPTVRVFSSQCDPVFPYPKNTWNHQSGSGTVLHIEEPVLAQWRALFNAVVAMVETAHRNGEQEGSNMLARLARNEVSVADFNEWQEKLRKSR